MARRTILSAIALLSAACAAGCVELAGYTATAASDGDGRQADAASAQPPTDDNGDGANATDAFDASDGGPNIDLDQQDEAGGDATSSDDGTRRDLIRPRLPDGGGGLPCVNDGNCAPTSACCDNVCVPILFNGLHCGGCYQACTPLKPNCCNGTCYASFGSPC